MPLNASLFVGAAFSLLLVLEALFALACLSRHVLAAGLCNSAIALLDLFVPIRAGMAPHYRDLRRHLNR
jgi:hypothetical protein